MLNTLLAQALNEQEGSAYWFLNNLITVKATTESTGGSFSLCHQLSPPGSATPYHVHHTEDEAFYILQGESTFTCGGEKTVASPGTYLFLPRGIPHGIQVTGTIPTEMLLLVMPGKGFIGMMEEMGEPARERVLPVPIVPDTEKLMKLCAKYQIDILGSIPA